MGCIASAVVPKGAVASATSFKEILIGYISNILKTVALFQGCQRINR